MEKIFLIIAIVFCFGCESVNINANKNISIEPQEVSIDKIQITDKETVSITTIKNEDLQNTDNKKLVEDKVTNAVCKVEGLKEHYEYDGECINGVAQTSDGKIASLKYTPSESLKGYEYSGNFKNGYFEGNGSIKFKNGDSYNGQFKLGKIQGKGTYYWFNNNRYSGDFQDDKKEGEGVFYNAIEQSFHVVHYKNDAEVINILSERDKSVIDNIRKVAQESVSYKNNEELTDLNNFRRKLQVGMSTNFGVVVEINKANGQVLIRKNKLVYSTSGVTVPIPITEWVDINNIYPPNN